MPHDVRHVAHGVPVRDLMHETWQLELDSPMYQQPVQLNKTECDMLTCTQGKQRHSAYIAVVQHVALVRPSSLADRLTQSCSSPVSTLSMWERDELQLHYWYDDRSGEDGEGDKNPTRPHWICAVSLSRCTLRSRMRVNGWIVHMPIRTSHLDSSAREHLIRLTQAQSCWQQMMRHTPGNNVICTTRQANVQQVNVFRSAADMELSAIGATVLQVSPVNQSLLSIWYEPAKAQDQASSNHWLGKWMSTWLNRQMSGSGRSDKI